MKYLTTLVYATVLVVFMAIISIGLGVLLFGAGDLLVPGQTIVILSRNEALPRLLLAFAAATVGMWTVASLAFFLSSLVENGIGPIVGTMAVIIVFYIVSNVPVELFTSIKPWLFTTYLDVWRKVLDEPIPWTDVARSLGILGGHCVGFYLATWYIFAHKDILS
jgi:ABC-2 type transport system permease protein